MNLARPHADINDSQRPLSVPLSGPCIAEAVAKIVFLSMQKCRSVRVWNALGGSAKMSCKVIIPHLFGSNVSSFEVQEGVGSCVRFIIDYGWNERWSFNRFRLVKWRDIVWSCVKGDVSIVSYKNYRCLRLKSPVCLILMFQPVTSWQSVISINLWCSAYVKFFFQATVFYSSYCVVVREYCVRCLY